MSEVTHSATLGSPAGEERPLKGGLHKRRLSVTVHLHSPRALASGENRANEENITFFQILFHGSLCRQES